MKSTGTSIGESNALAAGVDYEPNDHWEFHGGISGWKDKVNFIHYIGPSVEATYNWLRPGTSDDNKDKDDDEKESEEDEVTRTPPSNSFLSLWVSVEYLVYGTDVETSSRTVVIRRGNRLITREVSPKTRTETIDQLHPSAEIDAPLLAGYVTPSISGGIYRYSKDPNQIEALAGQPRFATVAARLNSLVGGFLKKEWASGLSLTLPLGLNIHGSYGRSQSATDQSWSNEEAVDLKEKISHSVKLEAGWSRAVQNDVAQTLWSGGATYTF